MDIDISAAVNSAKRIDSEISKFFIWMCISFLCFFVGIFFVCDEIGMSFEKASFTALLITIGFSGAILNSAETVVAFVRKTFVANLILEKQRNTN